MEDKLMVTKGRKVRINLEYGINTHTITCKRDKQQEFTL